MNFISTFMQHLKTMFETSSTIHAIQTMITHYFDVIRICCDHPVYVAIITKYWQTNFNDHLLIPWPALSTPCHYSLPLIQASIWQRKPKLFKMGIISKTSSVNVAIITRVVWRKWRSQYPSRKIYIVFSFFCFIFSNECQLTAWSVLNK